MAFDIVNSTYDANGDHCELPKGPLKVESGWPNMRDLMSRTCSELSISLFKKKHAIIEEIFLRETGEELTVDNVNRVTIVLLGRDCPISSSIFTTHKDLYLIDGVPAIMMYPLDVDLARSTPVTIKASVKYDDLAQKTRDSIVQANIKELSEGELDAAKDQTFQYITPIIHP